MHSLYLLLLIAAVHSIHIPFYCKIRKTNCELRPESTCCQHLSTTTTSTTSAATVSTLGDTVTIFDTVGVTEIPQLNEAENIQNTSLEEVFEAQPSEIDEVYVKVTGENIETNFITSTAKPEKYAPRFCLKLKFNCKLRSSHACCKYPLPPRDENQSLTTAYPKPVKLQVRPTRIQIPPASDSVGKIKTRKSPFRRPLRTQQTKIENRKEEVDEESSDSHSKENTKKATLRKKVQRPAFNPIRKSTIKRRRPAYFSNNKSPVCRIINCKRNKNHKCCQTPTERSTVAPQTTSTESITTQSSSTTSTTESFETTKYAEMITEKEPKKGEDDEFKKEMMVEPSSSADSTPSDHIQSEIMFDLTKVPIEEFIKEKESLEEVSELNKNNSTRKGQSEGMASEEMMMDYFTTIIPEFETHKTVSTSPSQNETTQDEKTAVENKFVPDENLDIQNTSKNSNAGQAMYQQMNETRGQKVNNETVEEEAKLIEIPTEQSGTMDENNIEKSDSIKLTNYFESENPIKPVILIAEKVLEDYPAYGVDYSEYFLYEGEEPVETEAKIILPPNIHAPIPYNEIDQEALDLNQILPRVAVECFRFDCLSQPQHACCNPHITNKRQTRPSSPAKQEVMEQILEDHPGRVTATVTRVQKTVRW